MPSQPSTRLSDTVHPLVQMVVHTMASGSKCDYEHCPGRRANARKRLIWHNRYLFVHSGCVQGARASARERGESFGFRLGL